MRTPFIRPVDPIQFTVGGFFKTAFLPGILPNLQRLAGAFSKFLFVFTQVFGMTGLIDRHHPCMQPENIGRYRFVDIVGLAYYGMLQDRKNSNKLFMFLISVLTLVFVITFFVVTILYFMTLVPKAHAQFFSDSTADQYEAGNDFAYQFLSEVFGNTGIQFWGPEGSFHGGGTKDMHILFGPIIREMFSTYSQALLIIAVVMIIYHIVVMVSESARTGQPFGENFNSVWAPVRLAMAIGLLVPISNGYNGAQLIAFQVSAWGSALATNVWNEGLGVFGNVEQQFDVNEDGELFATGEFAANSADVQATAQKLIVAMQPSHGYRFMRGLFLTKVCEVMLNKADEGSNLFTGLQAKDDYDKEGLYYNNQVGTYPSEAVQYTAAALTGGVVGVAATAVFDPFPAVNIDYCGSYKVPIYQRFEPQEMKLIGGGTPANTMASASNSENPVQLSHLAHEIAKAYYRFYSSADQDTLFTVPGFGIEVTTTNSTVNPADVSFSEANDALEFTYLAAEKIVAHTYAASDDQQNRIQGMSDQEVLTLHANLLKAYQTALGYNAETKLYFQTDVFKQAAQADAEAIILILNSGKKYGWASAGSVMMLLAQANNLVSSAVNTPPVSTSLPRLMANPLADPYFRNESVTTGFWGNIISALGFETLEEQVTKANKLLAESNTWFVDTIFNGTLAQDNHVDTAAWRAELKDRAAENQTDVDMLSTGGMQSFLLSFVYMTNENMNPLAHVIAVGNGLMGVATGILAIGLLLNLKIAGAFSLAMSIAFPLILGAYLLAVVLPFALFMHFFFAVVEWIMSVFEAVVGMPLFALSFISVSGEGIGDKAMNGVMKLFEIMLRPTVIVICAVGAMVIFSAAVHFFNRSYTLFMLNYFDSTDGTIKNGLVVFGSLFLYVLTVYSIGNSCFKMIPTIANQFGNWMGLPNGFGNVMETNVNQLAGLAAMGAVVKGAGDLGKVGSNLMDKRIAGRKQGEQEALQKALEDKSKRSRLNNQNSQARATADEANSRRNTSSDTPQQSSFRDTRSNDDNTSGFSD